jgi:hypothetical protein
MQGYEGSSIDFLHQFPMVRDVTLVHPVMGNFDLRPIEGLVGLRGLTVSGPLLLSLKCFPELRTLRGEWCTGMDVSSCKNLAVLQLSSYAPRSKSLVDVPALGSLREVILIKPNIVSLAGIERFALQRLEIAYAAKLTDASAVGAIETLESLELVRCRGVDVAGLSMHLRRLRSLRVRDGADLASLGFLKQMPLLEDFRFVGTNVVDGDLRPLLGMRSVGFLHKRHYSHTPEQVDAILGERDNQ